MKISDNARGDRMKEEFPLRGLGRLRGLVAWLTVLALAACATPLTQPLTGVVVDAVTGQPVVDAVVVATWPGSHGFGDGSQHCAHVESTRTDAQGRFSLAGAPTGRGADTDFKYRFLTIYKEGYRSDEEGASDRNTVEAKLVHVPRSREQRFAELSSDFRSSLDHDCGEADGSNKNLYRLHIRQIAELRDLAITKADKSELRFLESMAKMDLVNFTRPTEKNKLTSGPESGLPINVDPNDAFKAEDVLK